MRITMPDLLIAMRLTSKCLLLLVVMIKGLILKDGNRLPFTSKKELENDPAFKHVEDICIKLRASITSKTGVPYDMIGCIFSSLIAPPNQTEVIVSVKNNGSAELQKFVNDLYSECERQRNDTNITGLNLQQQYEAAIGDGYATIWIAMKFVGEVLTGEWLSVYGSATEVMHIAKTTCMKYEKMANTEKRYDKKNFTCVVTGPHWGHLKGQFVLQFEWDAAVAFSFYKRGFGKGKHRNWLRHR